MAAFGAQAAQFRFGLDAFGGDGDAKAFAETDDGADDRVGPAEREELPATAPRAAVTIRQNNPSPSSSTETAPPAANGPSKPTTWEASAMRKDQVLLKKRRGIWERVRGGHFFM